MGKGKAAGGRDLHADPLENLEKQPTRTLLQELRRMRVQATQYEASRRADEACQRAGLRHAEDLIEADEFFEAVGEYPDVVARRHDEQYIAALKTELAKRPHVPNKPEAKALRQQHAREQRAR